MKFIILIFLIPISALSQNISGVWKGHLYNDTTKHFMPFELAINEDQGKLNAYSYTVFLLDSFENIGIKTIKLSFTDGKYFLEDDKLIFNNYKEPPAKGVRMYATLFYINKGNNEELTGTWSTNRTKDYNPLTGTLALTKVGNVEETAILRKLDEIGLRRKLSFIKEKEQKKQEISSLAVNEKRKTEIITPVVSDSINQKVVAITPDKNQENLLVESVKKEDKSLLASNEKNKEPGKKKDQLAANIEQKKTINPAKEIPEKNIFDSVKKKNSGNDISLNEKNNKKSLAAPDGLNRSVPDKISPSQNEKPKPLEEAKNVLTAEKQKTEKNIQPSEKEIDQPENKKLPVKIDPIVKAKIPETPAAAQIATRKIETIRTVEISNDSLVLSLFDNGTVDGDTVTVVVNGIVVWPMIGLRERAMNKTIYLTPEMGDSISVVMYAENLGSIAPNTGLLVIREGGKNHEIRFSGDLQKNSAIILKRKKIK